MARLMRALIIDATRSASVQRVAVPVPGPRQAVVDIHRVGICGTDIELSPGNCLISASAPDTTGGGDNLPSGPERTR